LSHHIATTSAILTTSFGTSAGIGGAEGGGMGWVSPIINGIKPRPKMKAIPIEIDFKVSFIIISHRFFLHIVHSHHIQLNHAQIALELNLILHEAFLVLDLLCRKASEMRHP
jgi:hypothetical protein